MEPQSQALETFETGVDMMEMSGFDAAYVRFDGGGDQGNLTISFVKLDDPSQLESLKELLYDSQASDRLFDGDNADDLDSNSIGSVEIGFATGNIPMSLVPLGQAYENILTLDKDRAAALILKLADRIDESRPIDRVMDHIMYDFMYQCCAQYLNNDMYLIGDGAGSSCRALVTKTSVVATLDYFEYGDSPDEDEDEDEEDDEYYEETVVAGSRKIERTFDEIREYLESLPSNV